MCGIRGPVPSAAASTAALTWTNETWLIGTRRGGQAGWLAVALPRPSSGTEVIAFYLDHQLAEQLPLLPPTRSILSVSPLLFLSLLSVNPDIGNNIPLQWSVRPGSNSKPAWSTGNRRRLRLKRCIDYWSQLSKYRVWQIEILDCCPLGIEY